jgi:hypothetical protein
LDFRRPETYRKPLITASNKRALRHSFFIWKLIPVRMVPVVLACNLGELTVRDNSEKMRRQLLSRHASNIWKCQEPEGWSRNTKEVAGLMATGYMALRKSRKTLTKMPKIPGLRAAP